MFEPLLPKLTPREDLWETAQALKVLSFGDLRYTDKKNDLRQSSMSHIHTLSEE